MSTELMYQRLNFIDYVIATHVNPDTASLPMVKELLGSFGLAIMNEMQNRPDLCNVVLFQDRDQADRNPLFGHGPSTPFAS